MKLIDKAILVCALWLFLSSPLQAEEKRFLETRGPTGATEIFDLASVQMIAPGRFTIQNISLDDVDVMKFKLGVLSAQRELCERAAPGKYRPREDVFRLGSPDLPVSDFEVTQNSPGVKIVQWSYPYKRLASGESSQSIGFLKCGKAEDFLDAMKSITNGSRTKYLYDCKRGLGGPFFLATLMIRQRQ